MTYNFPDYKLTEVSHTDKERLLSERVDWSRKVANLQEVWKTTQGEEVNVGILDSGIMEDWSSSPDFAGSVIDAKNFTTRDESDIIDRNDHGTLLASIVGARADGTGVAGVAPKCNLLIGKIANESQYKTEHLINGLEWLAKTDAHIISLSLGEWCQSKKLYNAISALTNKGKIVICSAGNDKSPPSDLDCRRRDSKTIHYPAWYPETIAVGSINRQYISSSPAEGDEIDFVAPGVGMYGVNRKGFIKQISSGTSFSTAYLSGICALILSYYRQGIQKRTFNVDQMRLYLKRMCIDLGVQGKDKRFGMGIPINWIFKSDAEFIRMLQKRDLTESGFTKLLQFITK